MIYVLSQSIQLIHPKVLAISYPGYQDEEDDIMISGFSPGPEHAVNLRHVFMDITLPDNPPDALFDFGGIPDTTIQASLHLGVTYYLAISVYFFVFSRGGLLMFFLIRMLGRTLNPLFLESSLRISLRHTMLNAFPPERLSTDHLLLR